MRNELLISARIRGFLGFWQGLPIIGGDEGGLPNLLKIIRVKTSPAAAEYRARNASQAADEHGVQINVQIGVQIGVQVDVHGKGG